MRKFAQSEPKLTSRRAFPHRCLPDDGNGALVAKEGVVVKHIARRIMDIVAFADALWIMLGSNETLGDCAELSVSFFHEATGAGLRDELGNSDASGISRIGEGRTGLDQTEQILGKGGKIRFAQHLIHVARGLANFARRSHGKKCPRERLRNFFGFVENQPSVAKAHRHVVLHPIDLGLARGC